MNSDLPEQIQDDAQLEDLLSTPSPGAIDAMQHISGDVLLLGAGGKMGPSLARMLVRASNAAGIPRRVMAVSRFGTPGLSTDLNEDGIETIAGDLLDPEFVNQLPDAPHVVFMTGTKFGTSSGASATWAMNVWVPSLVCQRFRSSRILAFSTGNVYPFVPVESGGATEEEALNPVGEYGMSALGRERMFEYFSLRDSIPLSIVRLNYAVEMRYGVLVDLARKVLAGEPIDLSMGHANVIWQGDANAMVLQALADAASPPFVINVAGPEVFAVQDVCARFGELLERQVEFTGQPAANALLNNACRACEHYGLPRVSLDTIVRWTADWLRRGGTTWGKPTHFEVRDGKF